MGTLFSVVHPDGQRDLHFCVTKILHGIQLECNFEPIWHNGIEMVILDMIKTGDQSRFVCDSSCSALVRLAATYRV